MEKLDRTTAPKFQLPTSVSFQKVESTFIGNGIPVHILNMGETKICRVEILFCSGKWYEPKPGVAYLCSEMLLSGTKKLSSEEINNHLDFYGAFTEVTNGFDFITFTLYCQPKYLPKIIPFLTDVFLECSFPEEELELQKRITIQNIVLQKKQTRSLSNNGFRQVLFSDAHPYGSTLTEEQVLSVSREDLLQYHLKNLFAEMTLFISGNVSPSEEKEITTPFEKWKYFRNKTTSYSYSPTSSLRHIIPLENTVQSSLKMGHYCIQKNHHEFITLTIVNEILGGYFGSRLMKNIREKQGLTYGIHSSFVHLKQESYWFLYSDIHKESVLFAVEEILKEMRILKTNPVSKEEMDLVCNYMKGSFLSSLNTPFQLMDKFKNINIYGLDYGYYDEFYATLQHISAEDILYMSQKYLQEETWIQVIAGGI
ncbi:MAG: pitrilysin family protein [Chitinophagaceae bacterium]|nr:pitrilysin family protein [Chitinophagaceae bacterium]